MESHWRPFESCEVCHIYSKAKKSPLMTYLLGRVEEINQRLGFLYVPERHEAEHNWIVVK
jgi:hypothetical protein